jgi:hypothetical protein
MAARQRLFRPFPVNDKQTAPSIPWPALHVSDRRHIDPLPCPRWATAGARGGHQELDRTLRETVERA